MRVSCLITIGYSLVAATALPAQAVISGNDDRGEDYGLCPEERFWGQPDSMW